jgi:hypothetical protein
VLKPNNAFLSYLGNATTVLLMNGTILKYKTYLFNPSDAAQNPKMISDRNSQDIYSDPGSFETIKIRMANKFLLLKTTTPFFY